MASTITDLNQHIGQRMSQVRADHPDRRTRLHKQAVIRVYESTIASLIVKLSKETKRNNVLRTRVALANRDATMFGTLFDEEDDDASNGLETTPPPSPPRERDGEPTPSCPICMEDMCGRVTLVCGHEMCPECFAQHSRVNNTCSFCRAEFAPKPKKQSKMPLYQIDNIVERWAYEPHWQPRWTAMTNMLCRRFDGRPTGGAEAESYLQWIFTRESKTLMKKVKDWYDNDIV